MILTAKVKMRYQIETSRLVYSVALTLLFKNCHCNLVRTNTKFVITTPFRDYKVRATLEKIERVIFM